jgi:glycosyltransferase involved in cell wall biosynthesis
VKKGHEVTVVSSIYSKSDLKASKLLETQWIDGIQVKVINVRIDNKQHKLKRIYTFIVYALLSSWYAIRLPADVVVASSGPITVGIPGLVARYLRNRILVFETRDLWPEGAIELGIIKNKLVKYLAYTFERFCYRASALIVALSPGMKQYIEKRHGHHNVISVTNAANIALFSTPATFPENIDLEPKKYAIYTGNIGEVNNAYWMLEAAKILHQRGEKRIKIVLIGDGQQKDVIKNEAQEFGLSNFLILDLMTKNDLIPLIQQALVSLVPLKGTPVLDTSSPNKFFESLAAGVPIIQNTNGWMKKFLEDYNVGFTIDPNRPEALADCLIEIMGKPALLSQMGKNGAALAKQQFDKTVLAQQMLDGLMNVVFKKKVQPE